MTFSENDPDVEAGNIEKPSAIPDGELEATQEEQQVNFTWLFLILYLKKRVVVRFTNLFFEGFTGKSAARGQQVNVEPFLWKRNC